MSANLIVIGRPGPRGPAPLITWDDTVIEVDGVPGPDLEGPAPSVSWTGDRLTVGGVQGPPLTGPEPVITFDGTIIEVDGVPGPDLKGDTGTPGITTRYPVISVSSPITITTGIKPVRVVIPYAMTITRWRLIADQATTATVRVYLSTGAEITGSVLPTLTAQASATGTTLTGWTTALSAGDVIYINVASNSAATFLSLVLEG